MLLVTMYTKNRAIGFQFFVSKKLKLTTLILLEQSHYFKGIISSMW